MCEPTTILMATSLALSAAQARGQYQAQKGMNTRNRRAANQQLEYNTAMNNVTRAQNQEDAAKAAEQLRRESAAKQATARAAAAESGVAGLSVDAVLNELSGQAAEAQQQIDTNYARQALQQDATQVGLVAQHSNTLANLPANPYPDYLGMGLKLGQGVVSGARAGDFGENGIFGIKPRTPTTTT